ncbi:hypothetical protein M422DRAFT_34633 [Sphaerobolus stellatus SS14]|uniref:Uncharacterized protein n=1 Tax=Sphaerobolus stellatus (strain SS14) TaxID=990650 RepID=A0A0C9TYA9_SPHS4|nr:hypothetical protein M422DRAFT_34633 [Sphaerobolus stellatus SS14]
MVVGEEGEEVMCSESAVDGSDLRYLTLILRTFSSQADHWSQRTNVLWYVLVCLDYP